MLLELSIKNFAIIQDLKIEFTKGLNLLTGETGSGKSIIIEALGIILGARASRDLIRSGEEKSILQALFYIEEDKKLNPILQEYGIHIEDDNLIIITREISLNGPSISRINGYTVTLSILNKVSSILVDIFGQHEHQSLLNTSNHQILIDTFGDIKFKNLKENIKSYYEDYSNNKVKLKNLTMNSSDREREMDLLKFQIDEINNANLSVEEDEELENEYNKLSNVKNIISGLGEICQSINREDYESPSILEYLNKDISLLNNLTNFDKNLKPYLIRMENIEFELIDLAREFDYYMDKLDMDEEKLIFLRDRINLTNKLKRKYGNTIEKIIEYRDIVNNTLIGLINYEEEVEIIKKTIMKLEKKLIQYSQELSIKRKEIATVLQEKIMDELMELNMGKIKFQVDFKEKSNLSSNGLDNIEFLIATNSGEDVKSLSKIVSGGEMSRIMLGFKSIIAKYDGIPTLIFDEIDTGISGRTAQIVGEKISKISKEHQVICISHLPQIAALADSHYVISKDLYDDKTLTKINRLTEEERIIEMARLLGGVDVTEITLNHAREMLEMSKKIKKVSK